ncbi:MAG: TetR/AcrR family transcriptional regulator [Pseudomonadota bacterium]
MAQQSTPNDTIMESLFEVFRCHGYEGTTLSQLSEVTGLRKSSLYHYFPEGKVDMVKAVVSYFSGQLQQNVIEPLLDTQKTPQARFSTMVETLKTFYSNGAKNCLLNTLSLGEAKEEIRAQVSKNYFAFLEALQKLGMEAGLKSNDAKLWAERFLVVVEGTLIIQRLTANPLAFDKAMDFERKQFLSL